MKYVIWVAIAVAAVYFGKGLFAPSAPSARDVEPLVRDYLLKGNGYCTIEHLSDVSVGKYMEPFGGWPVYASHQETCRQASTTDTNVKIDTSTTYLGRADAQKDVAVAYVRRTSGGSIELFVPSMFEQAKQPTDQAMQGALDKASGR